MKIKTRKAAKKRFQVTGAKVGRKFMRRQATQDHFNARDRGKKTTGKRQDVPVAKADRASVRRMLPNR